MKKLSRIIICSVVSSLLISGSIFASPEFDIETDLSYLPDMITKNEIHVDNINTRATFSISAINLSPGFHASAGSASYYVTSSDQFEYSINWSPSGQDLRFILIGKSNGLSYVTPTMTGGSSSGILDMSDVQSGEYTIHISAPYSNTSNVSSANATLRWK